MANTVTKSNGDVLLANTMPQAEYMYGCVATSLGMLLGYYDSYGYTVGDITYDMSNLIPGTISVDSRGSDGKSIYDMKDPSKLALFIASEGYVERFYNKSPSEELPYTYINGDPAQGLNVSAWDSLADYHGTGQYWRGNGDLSTMHYYCTLDWLNTTRQTYSIDGRAIPVKFVDFKYGLSLYVGSRGYALDGELTESFEIDGNNGDFTFSDFMAEIDAGRPVLLSTRAAIQVDGDMQDARGNIFRVSRHGVLTQITADKVMGLPRLRGFAAYLTDLRDARTDEPGEALFNFGYELK